MGKPTTGPFEYRQAKNRFEVFKPTAGSGSVMARDIVDEADAKLYAAASDMAEALKELISTVEMYRENVYRRGNGTASNECVNMLSARTLAARKALAKAGVA